MDDDHRNARVGLIGAILIATLSGLIIRIVGEPLADVTDPKIKGFFKGVEEFFEDPKDFWDDLRD